MCRRGTFQPSSTLDLRGRSYRPPSSCFVDDAGVTVLLQFHRQALVTRLDDLAAIENVDGVRNDVIQEALIVSDHQKRAIRRTQCIDAIRHDLQRIYVEAGVCLIQNAELRLEKLHLQDLCPLLLTTGEANVQRTLQHVHIDIERAGSFLHPLQELRDLQLFLTTRLALRVHRYLEEL